MRKIKIKLVTGVYNNYGIYRKTFLKSQKVSRIAANLASPFSKGQ